MDRLFEIRYAIQTAIEPRIQAKEFSRNNEAAVALIVPANDPAGEVLRDTEAMKEIFILAELDVSTGDALTATARKTTLHLCPRCRRHEPTLDNGLCQRCHNVVNG